VAFVLEIVAYEGMSFAEDGGRPNGDGVVQVCVDVRKPEGFANMAIELIEDAVATNGCKPNFVALAPEVCPALDAEIRAAIRARGFTVSTGIAYID